MVISWRRRRDCQGPDTHSEYDRIRNDGGIKSRANSSLLAAPIKNGEIDDVLLLRWDTSDTLLDWNQINDAEIL